MKQEVEIKEYINGLLEESTYRITVKNLNVLEIGECFKQQFPNSRGIIIGGEMKNRFFTLKMLVVGLK